MVQKTQGSPTSGSGCNVATATNSCPFATQCKRLKQLSFPPETRPMTLCFVPEFILSRTDSSGVTHLSRSRN